MYTTSLLENWFRKDGRFGNKSTIRRLLCTGLFTSLLTVAGVGHAQSQLEASSQPARNNTTGKTRSTSPAAHGTGIFLCSGYRLVGSK